ncbi:bifunctional 2',3'-cyclic-nucleotide 2'-phosphodiesterase/3'-nucleotidase [Pseudoduganella sp. GCM10020061]|uniref:bifunctional 2',3'-cyclic-nucleotide 2'-phosphodiesterase/3'-nucleotidase n=1 Tax=Pseudoduganella sp. GCM10020061 TaxID=3317345 RepID=UPI0036390BAB
MRYRIVSAAVASLFATVPACAVQPGATATLALLETSDLHANVLSYDYFKLAADPSFGLERTATLIAQARKEFANTLLLDNGDTIQGTALADYQALVKPVKCGETIAIYKALNKLGVEGSGIGNHEFNYGLDYLGQVTGRQFDVAGVRKPAKPCAGPAFPQVLANVYSARTKKPLFAPYHIIHKKVSARDANGKPVTATVKVGIIGFAPPMIMSWDKRHLEGKVYTEGLRETALRYVPEMRRKGADLVVAISHAGLDNSDYSPKMENGNWHLAQVPGAKIDAMLIGHSHQVFPNPASTVPQFNLPGVDKVRGTVHGVPTVMPSLWGKHLGVIALHLRHDGKAWRVEQDKTRVEARAAQGQAPDEQIARLIEREHEATIDYVKTPVGSSGYRMSTFFADVGDTSAISVVNLAQADYVAAYVAANLPQHAGLPVLAMSAPFKTGAAGVTDYTDVKAGPLALNNAADLYLYPNSLYAVKVDGVGLKAWLEKSAERFNRIDPARTEAQELINSGFPGYNFDMLTSKDVAYEIDVTQPAGARIAKLRYKGAPVEAGQEFIVATNNYRASGGGSFPGLDGSKTLLASPDTNRDVLIAYLKKVRSLPRERMAQERSWSFAKVKTAGPVVFRSAPGVLEVARDAGLGNVSLLKEDDGSGKGYSVYALDLAR